MKTNEIKAINLTGEIIKQGQLVQIERVNDNGDICVCLYKDGECLGNANMDIHYDKSSKFGNKGLITITGRINEVFVEYSIPIYKHE